MLCDPNKSGFKTMHATSAVIFARNIPKNLKIVLKAKAEVS